MDYRNIPLALAHLGNDASIGYKTLSGPPPKWLDLHAHSTNIKHDVFLCHIKTNKYNRILRNAAVFLTEIMGKARLTLKSLSLVRSPKLWFTFRPKTRRHDVNINGLRFMVVSTERSGKMQNSIVRIFDKLERFG